MVGDSLRLYRESGGPFSALVVSTGQLGCSSRAILLRVKALRLASSFSLPKQSSISQLVLSSRSGRMATKVRAVYYALRPNYSLKR